MAEFRGRFKKDYKMIIGALSKSRGKDWRIVIFVDDLDRCRPDKVVDVIEAIRLVIDNENCVFLVGMDSNAIITSIENRYSFLEKEPINSYSCILGSPGRRFLEKIIQIPLSIPKMSTEDRKKVIEDCLRPIKQENGNKPQDVNGKITEKAQPDETTASQDVQASGDTAKTQSKNNQKVDENHINEAIRFGASCIKESPRQIKRYINLFRFYTLILNEKGALVDDRPDRNSDGISLKKLGAWLALLFNWPEIIGILHDNTQNAHFVEFLGRLAWSVDPLEKLLKSAKDDGAMVSRDWIHFSWKRWSADKDFKKIMNELKDLWTKPENGENKTLELLLKLSGPPAGINRDSYNPQKSKESS